MKIYRQNANKPKFPSVDNSYETAKATLEKLEKEWDSMMGDFKSMGTKPKGYDELQRKLRAAQIAAREAYSKENAIADSDKAKLKELKAKLEKAADGTDEEFKKAQKAYDDFMDTVKSNKNNSLRIFRTVKNDLREESTRGHGFLTEKTARELQAKGTFIDYYTQSNGDKKYAKITKVSSSGYTVGGETFKFASYDH